MSVDVRTIKNRRELTFRSMEDVLTDARQIVSLDRDGKIESLGNWSLGKTLGHLAGAIDFSYDGFPGNFPWFLKPITRLMKWIVINRKMPQGVRIPGAPKGAYAQEEMSVDQGLGKLEKAWERLSRLAPTVPHPAFGKLTQEQLIKLHLRHCELHLSYFRPK